MYDRLVESVRLIEGGLPDERVGLSRRRRFQPIAVDVDGDVAVTAFLVRVHGGATWDNNVLERRRGEWRMLGGGGGGGYPYDELLRPPSCATPEGRHVSSNGSGGTATGSSAGRDGWIAYAELELCEHVGSLVLGGSRVIALPWHRRAMAVWRGRAGSRLTVLDPSGTDIETLPLPGTHR